MAYTTNPWGRKTQHKASTKTQTYVGSVKGESFETTATTENSAKFKIKLRYNRKHRLNDNVFQEVTITSVR